MGLMKSEQSIVDVELRHEGISVKLKALVDTGASRSLITKSIAEKLKAFTPLSKPYELRTADERGRLRIIGYSRVGMSFQDIEVPGGVVFEVAENLREDVELIIGRPEVNAWDIIFAFEGPRPRKVPIEFEII